MRHSEEKIFTIEDLIAKTARKLNVSVGELQDTPIVQELGPYLEVICEELDDIRKTLRRKI